MRKCLALALLIAAPACEPPLPAGWPHDAGTDAGLVTFTPITGGHAVVLDAQDSSRFTAVDLDRPAEVSFESGAWDLAFSRFHVRARGGASGDGGVAVALVSDAGFEDVSVAPGGPYLVDLPDGDDDNMDLDTVFEKPEAWYDYEGRFHTLTPKPFVYVVHTDGNGYVKVKLDGYYDAAGTPAVFKLRVGRVSPP